MRPARLAEGTYLPKDGVDVARLRETLTVRWRDIEEAPCQARAYYAPRTALDIRVPRHYGRLLAQEMGWTLRDETALGAPLPAGLREVALYDYQAPFVAETCSRLQISYDVVAKAHTGSGKTVMGLEVVRRLGRAALILVDQEFLMDQWIARAQEFLGLAADEVGIIRGPRCEADRPVVVGMIQTLYQHAYERAVYRQFGTVIFDEVHVTGAEQFSAVLQQFPARYRLGLSATPRRGDPLQALLDWNLGPVQVTLEREHRPSSVRYLEHDGVVSFYSNISPKAGRYISELAEDTRRNVLLVEALWQLYRSPRDTLIVGDRVEHLENLMALAVFRGIPQEAMGLVAGYRTAWVYEKDPTPPRRPPHWGGGEYTPVRLVRVQKRLSKRDREAAKTTRQLVFATYGVFTKGVDEPRLCAGVEATPRAAAVQVHGRVLRAQDPNKLRPVWVTVRDIYSYRAEYQFLKRLAEYQASNAEVMEWRLDAGVRRWGTLEALEHRVRTNIRYLKQCRIQPQDDGTYTIVPPLTGKR